MLKISVVVNLNFVKILNVESINTLLFYIEKKCEKLKLAKASHFFPTINICVFGFVVRIYEGRSRSNRTFPITL